MITIKEFCEKYKVHCSGVYAKLKRHEARLKDHVFYISGKTVLDDFAEAALMPKHQNQKSQEAEKIYSEMEYRLQRRIELAEYTIKGKDKIIKSLNEQIEKNENDKNALIAKYENEKSAFIEEIENLKNQISKNENNKKSKFGFF